MNRTVSVYTTLAGLLLATAALHAQAFAAADVLLSYSDSETKVMALAKAVPEETYPWRPSPEARSFAEVFRHIASGNRMMLGLAENPSREALMKTIHENELTEKTPADKPRIIDELTASFRAARKAMESATAPGLERKVDFFGHATTLRGLYIAIDSHIAEHLGQAIAYARMNGIAPPWSPAAKAADDPLSVVRQSAGDWNRGDLSAFVKSYEQSPETTFVGTNVSRGTDNILERYRRNYPDLAHMGKLTFSELTPRTLAPGLVLVTGRFALEREPAAGGPARGIFTLVLRQGPNGWRIIHDHTSALP